MLLYLHADHLGSTLAATDATGQVVAGNQPRYDAYGKERTPAVGLLPTDYRYTGQRQDGTGLYDYGARRYDPALGAFLSPDTIVPQPGNPQALNRYAYALGNPLNFVDPTGHFSEDEIMGYLGESNWEGVLSLFGAGGRLEGRWGWLEMLRLAHMGDKVTVMSGIEIQHDGTMVAIGPTFTGVFGLQDGQLVVNGRFMSEDGPSTESITLSAERVALMAGTGSNASYRYKNGRYLGAATLFADRKYYHLRYDTSAVDWVSVGLGAANLSSDVGLGMLVSGVASGNPVVATAGASIWGIGTAAGPTQVARTYGQWRNGQANTLSLVVDVGTAVVGMIPGAGAPASASGILYNLAGGVRVTP